MLRQFLKRSPRMVLIVNIVSLVIIVASVAIIAALTIPPLVNKQRDEAPTEPSKHSASTAFTATVDNFSINFPKKPEVEQLAIDIEDVPVPYTQYVTEMLSGGTYLVQVTPYPPEHFDLSIDERSLLDDAIRGMGDDAGTTTMLSFSNDGTFLGCPSADAVFRVTHELGDYHMYTRVFTRNNTLYVIIGTNIRQSTYEKFMNSFSFLDQENPTT